MNHKKQALPNHTDNNGWLSQIKSPKHIDILNTESSLSDKSATKSDGKRFTMSPTLSKSYIPKDRNLELKNTISKILDVNTGNMKYRLSDKTVLPA